MSTSYTEKRYFTDKSVGGKKAIFDKITVCTVRLLCHWKKNYHLNYSVPRKKERKKEGKKERKKDNSVMYDTTKLISMC